MAMVDVKDLLYHAYHNRYAVGAFEIISLDFLQAVMQAAEQARSPVILNVVEPHFELYDIELLMAAIVRAANRATVPVAVHADHCSSPHAAQTAIQLGCNSVMFDAAAESFPVNVENTRAVVTMMHACGISVEGELGYVNGLDPDDLEDTDGGENPLRSHEPVFTCVEEAKAYIERTDVDFLAVSIGTVHGRAKTKSRLDYTRLARIGEKVKIPFVIHGGTGLTDQQYHKLIDYGVAKINCYTALAEIATERTRHNLSQDEVSYARMFAGVRTDLAAEVQRFMQVWGSAGRAAEVLMQCRAWHNVEHVIVYNSASSDPDVVGDMLIRGKQRLSEIPGVMEVRIGKAVNDQGKFRYCWLIRFAHERVIESYKSHPIHLEYADKHFRPLAADRITNDYEIVDAQEISRQFAPRSTPHELQW